MKISEFVPDGVAPRYFGVYPAIVTDITKDTNSLGRVEVKFPWLGGAGDDVRALATLCTPYADDDQGYEMIPAVDSQVVVGFEAGDLRRPYILGACWNGQASMPEQPAQPNNKRLIKTRAGSLLEFDDADGSAKVTMSMKSGHKLVMEDAGPKITLAHSGGSSMVIDSSGITITSTGTLTMIASSVTVTAPSQTNSGSITCMAFTATSVTSPTYSPGAGNVW
jgi:uncharacterized protein involved in type VI secretion and phage assembly